MLIPLTKQHFDEYVDFAYSLALDLTRSGYPTYTDGIKTFADFTARARKAFSRENEAILLYERDGRVAGWIHYFYLPADRYLDTCSFCVAEGMAEALEEFIAFARERFPGSSLYLGFPRDNAEAVGFLDSHGYPRIEESYNDVLHFDDYTPRPVRSDVIPITRENYPLFAAIHAQHDGDMYWNTQRILDAIDEWEILVLLRSGTAAGAIYYAAGYDRCLDEVFGVDFPDGAYDGAAFRELLTAALNTDKQKGAKHMVMFNDAQSQPDALACGFHCVGQYVCYLIGI